MKIISSIMALLCAHKMCSATENRSGKNCDDASVHTASDKQDNDYSSVFNRIQTICNVLPGSEMLLDVHNGEICMRLKWNPLVMNNQMPIINKVISAQEITEAEGARLMTAADIYQVMKKRNSAAMRGTTCNTLSRMLPAMGERVHTRYCNGYWVKEVESFLIS
jgi:hypothetical protein